MKNTHNMNYDSILSGTFYVEKLSISHNKTDSGNTYIRFSNEQLNDVLMYISNGECILKTGTPASTVVIFRFAI